MGNVLLVMPTVEGVELNYLQTLLKDFDDNKLQQFATIYSSRRKDPNMIALLAVVGFFGFAGIHRFMLDHIGMGLLYFFTAGLCCIGTIVDLVNYKKLTFEYNSKIAQTIFSQIAAN